MRLDWHFIGRAAPFTERVQGLQAVDFQIGPDVVLPVKGDLLHLQVSGRGDAAWFKCAGRRFDFASSDEPVMHIDLELA
jgi:hypothetical protein